MLIANRGPSRDAVVVTLPYMRQHKDAGAERDEVKIQLDGGPDVMVRAYGVLRTWLDTLNAKDRRWRFWSL